MSTVYDIIQSNTRSEADLAYCYRILFKADHTVRQHVPMPANFTEILDNLQLVSKTRIFGIDWCPFQFASHYLVKCTTEPRIKTIMIDGKNLHWVNCEFWKRMTVKRIQNCHALKEYANLCDTIYRSIIPKAEITPFIEKMIQTFVQFESERINAIIKEKGNSKAMILRYVFPVAMELPVENWDNQLCGIIDRIDRLTNDAYACLEYKYGKPKYLDTSWGAAAIHSELAFYNLLIQGQHVYVIDAEGNGTPILEYLHLESLEFYYGSMLFFQDVDTIQLFKITKASMSAMWKKVQNYWNRLNTGNFHPKPADACYTNCDYYEDVCEYNEEWKSIDHAMDGVSE